MRRDSLTRIICVTHIFLFDKRHKDAFATNIIINLIISNLLLKLL